jgi:hypothetical protein
VVGDAPQAGAAARPLFPMAEEPFGRQRVEVGIARRGDGAPLRVLKNHATGTWFPRAS